MYVRSLPSARVRVTHVIRVGTSNGICRAPAGPGLRLVPERAL